MLDQFNTHRTHADNMKLGGLTAFVAGMVNVASLMIFFAFTSNVTGHFAILAEEISKGNWYQVGVVFGWIFLFFTGSFVSNFIVINLYRSRTSMAHALPLFIEILCLVTVGIYGSFWYRESLTETEVLVALMLFAMGLQNGLTASISNFAVKTTHLTGVTTDLGILFSMFTRPEYRANKELRQKARLLLLIMVSYVIGGIFAGSLYLTLSFKVFYFVSILLGGIILYDFIKLRSSIRARKQLILKKRERHRRLFSVRQKKPLTSSGR
jgi:uncharacterized membrane protein YoaK (UPF0700 family)